MSKAVGGASAAGCGVFGILSLILGVGIVVWLGSIAMSGSTGGSDGDGDGGSGSKASTTVELDVPYTTLASTLDNRRDAGLPPGSTVSVLAGNDLGDGGRITVRGEAFPVAPMAVTMCLTDTPLAAEARCDTTTRVSVNVGVDGTFSLVYPAPRVITVAKTTYDCAARAEACSVLTQLDSRTDDVGISAPVTFAAGLPPVDAAIPPTN